METLIYKGIEFDEFTTDEYGTWATMCDKCYDKLKHTTDIESEIDKAGGGGVCSVKGCTNSDWEDADMEIHYFDFKDGGVSINEV